MSAIRPPYASDRLFYVLIPTHYDGYAWTRMLFHGKRPFWNADRDKATIFLTASDAEAYIRRVMHPASGAIVVGMRRAPAYDTLTGVQAVEQYDEHVKSLLQLATQCYLLKLRHVGKFVDAIVTPEGQTAIRLDMLMPNIHTMQEATKDWVIDEPPDWGGMANRKRKPVGQRRV